MNKTEETTNLPNWLQRSADNTPQKIAISTPEIEWTFAEFNQQAIQLAQQLATLGIQQGSRVALLASNGLPFVVCVHALIRLGAILVPLNVRLTLDEQLWLLQDVEAMALLSDEHYAERATEIQQSLPTLAEGRLQLERATQQVSLLNVPHDPDAPLLDEIELEATQAIMYTSGTTGTPKGVIITYKMQWWNAVGSALNLGHQADTDCWLLCMPLFHIGGLSILMKNVIYGIRIIVYEKFDARLINQAIREQGVSIISVVAIMLQRMLAELDASQQRYPATLRCVLLGGGPAPRPLLEDCASRNVPVVQTYGLTESCSQAVTLSPADALRKLGSAGRPLLPVQLRIMDEGVVVGPTQPGVICLKGPSITTGYDHRPDATAATIQDGWLATGDVGYLDNEGYLYVLDRRNDLIISGGENIYPAEIEATLLAHIEVEEAGVCGQPDAKWGQVPIAFVCLRPGSQITSTELLAYAAQRLARYKLPRAIHLVQQLPRNSSGKLLRRELPKLL
ncbi:o-succinylbenzoate--CoA ligase [Dictyobacter kobayashii]|uniref:2-succinylbenzoate--CoA ligase n=1 Tax=Dictyobacter kobayashii TaxID=2014872 RepID=A0A402AF36_9CHLR|nr:o-succinylbenzoate--CoA ligase [Dictyobacter kobayashii]GCE17705.1 2-succinylbenzoate--CoA ligase [Dictyobacter kobayashii]